MPDLVGAPPSVNLCFDAPHLTTCRVGGVGVWRKWCGRNDGATNPQGRGLVGVSFHIGRCGHGRGWHDTAGRYSRPSADSFRENHHHLENHPHHEETQDHDLAATCQTDGQANIGDDSPDDRANDDAHHDDTVPHLATDSHHAAHAGDANTRSANAAHGHDCYWVADDHRHADRSSDAVTDAGGRPG